MKFEAPRSDGPVTGVRVAGSVSDPGHADQGLGLGGGLGRRQVPDMADDDDRQDEGDRLDADVLNAEEDQRPPRRPLIHRVDQVRRFLGHFGIGEWLFAAGSL